MITQLSEETINEYAPEAQTIQQPTGTDFAQGVRVGKTIPAKWWNWLFNAVTKRIFQAKNDSQNMLTELQNAVTDAGIALDGTDNTQLTQAINAVTRVQVNDFVQDVKRALLRDWWTQPVKSNGSVHVDHLNSGTRLIKRDNSFAVVSGFTYTKEGSQVTYTGYALTTDCVNWFTVQDIDAASVTRAGDYYFGFRKTTLSNATTTLELVQFSLGSSGIYDLHVIDSYNTESFPSGSYSACLVSVVETGALYFFTPDGKVKGGFASPNMTMNRVLQTNHPGQIYYSGSRDYFITLESVEATVMNNKTYAANLVWSTGGSYTLGLWNVVCTGNLQHTRPIWLKNGAVAFIDIFESSEQVNTSYYLLDADGVTVTQQTGKPYIRYARQLYVNGALVGTNYSATVFSISYDGINFRQININDIHSFVQVNNGYYIGLNMSTTTWEHAGLYYYEGEIPANNTVEDFTPVSVPHTEVQYTYVGAQPIEGTDLALVAVANTYGPSGSPQSAAYLMQNGVIVGSGLNFYITAGVTDNRAIATLCAVDSRIRSLPNGSYAYIPGAGGLGLIVSKSSVNRVYGNTLYLR